MYERSKVMLDKYGRYSARCMVTLGLLLFLTGCAEGSQAILDLVPLQVQLAREYGASNLVIGLEDGKTLGITVVDDPAGSSSGDQRAEQARELAEFACEHYGSMGRIETVQVVFETRQGGFLVDSTASVRFTFAGSELGHGDG
jgi:hypothetical protein